MTAIKEIADAVVQEALEMEKDHPGGAAMLLGSAMPSWKLGRELALTSDDVGEAKACLHRNFMSLAALGVLAGVKMKDRAPASTESVAWSPLPEACQLAEAALDSSNINGFPITSLEELADFCEFQIGSVVGAYMSGLEGHEAMLEQATLEVTTLVAATLVGAWALGDAAAEEVA